MTAVEVVRDTKAILVESIWWDAAADELVWVDIIAGTIHRGRLDGALDGSDDRVTRLPPPLSAVQPRIGGGYVAALRDRVVTLDVEGETESTLAVIRHEHAGLRLNEGKVEPQGRFVVGSMNLATGEPDGAIYSIEPDGACRVIAGGFGVANGMEWSDDGATFYVTDTSVKTVYRAEYAPDGQLGPLEPFLTGYDSDGLALDTEGSFWNGVYGGGSVVHWTADGDVSEEYTLPVPNITSVAFGGTGFGSLFIGSAREQLTEADLVAHPPSGGIFRLDVGATGRPPNFFRG